jgi:hypothetical protein
MSEHILAILASAGIDPNAEVQTNTGGRTAYQVLESAIEGALDEIEARLS